MHLPKVNRLLSVVLGVLLLSVAAYADTTPSAACGSPLSFTAGAGGPTPVSCPAFSVPGTLTGVTLSYIADYQFGGAANNIAVVFAPAGPGGVTWTLATTTLNVIGAGSSGSEPTGSATATAGVSNAAFSAAFNVNVSSSVVTGSVLTSSGAVSIVYTFTPPPAISLSCPASTGQVGIPYVGALVATGGVPAYTFSITSGSLPPVLTLNPSTGAITGTPTTAGPFAFTAKVVDSTGTVAGTTTASCSITIGGIPPPPSLCNPSTLTFGNGGAPDTFQVKYISNLSIGDSYVNISNAGTSSTTAFPAQNGNICANVFTFSPDEQLISCCACPVTPDGLVSLSARNDLISNTLTPGVPTSIVVKLVASSGDSAGGPLVGGMNAWGTTIHALPVTPGSPATTYGGTETPFTNATLSQAELTRLKNLCLGIQTNGSGFGICKSCRFGGSADTQP